MFGTHNLWIFLFAGIALNLVPGQDTLYILGRSVAQGRVAGIVSVLGIGSGCVVHILAATVGLYSLLALSPFAFTAICLAGGTYLVYLGIMTVISRNNTRPAFTFGDTSEAKWQIYRQGVLTNLLNPKVAVMYLSLIPQFERPEAGHLVLQGFVLGGVQIAVSLAVNLAIVFAAAATAAFLVRRSGWLRAQRYLMASVLGALAVRLLFDHGRPSPA